MQNFRPDSPNNRFRLRRFRLFQEIVDEVIAERGVCHILDVGGTAAYWDTFGSGLDWDKLKVSLLNLTISEPRHPTLTAFAGDARDMRQFKDLSFDVIHSNSVIEHVGRWDDMAAMAKEVRRLAPRYFLQTPYYWFPIEPHARFPCFHWMPESWRYRIVMKRSCGFWQKRDDVGTAVRAVQSAALLDKRQMQYLFPDARIVSEKFFGLTKSLIAIR
jgi:hypothetical protein